MIKGIVKGLIVLLLAAIFSVQGVYAELTAISQQAADGYTLEFQRLKPEHILGMPLQPDTLLYVQLIGMKRRKIGKSL
ncbi:hypothetical protein [Paenibacillus sp. FSL L8-0158]|uniref:hypothetical protein n=1 Tax=Paenibacillus sp. FSL L8-0158 TaxID=2954752 RepID=UPI0031596236